MRKCLFCRWITPSRYKSVEGEVCLITGAASGIGRLMALEFARRKAILVLWDIDEKGESRAESLAGVANRNRHLIDLLTW